MIKWTLQTKKIKTLIPFHKNPRFINEGDFKQLQTSIAKFGLIDKPIVNTDSTIIGGHQRIEALKANGVKEVECNIPDHLLTPEEIEELCVRLNKNTGEFDYDILANEFNMEHLLEWGFNEKELGLDEWPEVVEEKELIDDDKDKTISCPKCGHEFLK